MTRVDVVNTPASALAAIDQTVTALGAAGARVSPT